MTDEEREALFRLWIDRLMLQNWSISALLNAGIGEMQDRRAAGECAYRTTIRSAEIHILRQDAYADPNAYDFEATLVHELLHIKLGIVYDTLEGAALELLHQAINDLSIALARAGHCGAQSTARASPEGGEGG